MAKSKLIQANQKIADRVVSGYQKMEHGVVSSYQKIEDSVVGGFTKITDQFVEQFLTREGESVQEAKERLAAEQAARSSSASHPGQHIPAADRPGRPSGGRKPD